MVVIGRVGYFLCENFGVVLVVGVVCIVFRVCQTKKIATEVQRITPCWHPGRECARHDGTTICSDESQINSVKLCK